MICSVCGQTLNTEPASISKAYNKPDFITCNECINGATWTTPFQMWLKGEKTP